MAAVPEARTTSTSKCSSPRPSPANVIEVYVEGIAGLALVDTGVAVSVISAKLCRMLRNVLRPLSDLSLRTATAQNITPLAACTARVFIQGVLYTVEFVVLPSCSHDIILGWDFLATNNAVIDCCHAELELSALHDFESIDDHPSSDKLFVSEDNAVPPCSSLLVLYHASLFLMSLFSLRPLKCSFAANVLRPLLSLLFAVAPRRCSSTIPRRALYLYFMANA